VEKVIKILLAFTLLIAALGYLLSSPTQRAAIKNSLVDGVKDLELHSKDSLPSYAR